METIELSRIIEELESGSREKGGSIQSGIISIGGTQISDNGGFKWDKKEFISENFYLNMRTGKVQKQDILIVKDRATTGKTSFVEEDFPFKDCAINEHVFRIQINKNYANPKFVFYFLRSPNGQQQILNDFRGATVGGISRAFVDKVIIPLPDLEIQNKIVTILDKAKAILDKREATLQKYEELLMAIFLEMFGDPVKNDKSWEQVELTEICTKITDGTHKTPNYLSKGVKIISAKNVKKNTISWSDIKYISESESNLINSRCNPEFEDILLTKSGSLGQPALIDVNFKFTLFESLALIKYNRSKVLPSFLITYLMSDGVSYFFRQRHKGVTIKHLHLVDIKSIPVYLPPFELQSEFGEKYANIKSIKKNLEVSIEKLKLIQNALSQLAFKGELDFNTAVDLEMLLENDYTFFKENSNKETIKLLLKRLDKDELNDNKFYDQRLYDKAKEFVFELLKEDKIKQVFDNDSKRVKLTVDEIT